MSKPIARCTLDLHWLHLVYFKFKINLPGLGGSPLASATPSSKLPPATKNHQADYLPATYCPYAANFKLHLYFPGWLGGNNQT